MLQCHVQLVPGWTLASDEYEIFPQLLARCMSVAGVQLVICQDEQHAASLNADYNGVLLLSRKSHISMWRVRCPHAFLVYVNMEVHHQTSEDQADFIFDQQWIPPTPSLLPVSVEHSVQTNEAQVPPHGRRGCGRPA